MNDIEREFEQYVDDLRAQLGAAKVTGSVGDDDEAEINDLINEHRRKIESAESEEQARRVFNAFKTASERYGQGAGMP